MAKPIDVNGNSVYLGDSVSLTKEGVDYFNNRSAMPVQIGEVVANKPIYQVVGYGHYFLSAHKDAPIDFPVIRSSDRVWIGWFKYHMIYT